VSNAGPSDAVGATVADVAPAGTTITGWSAVFAGGATGTASGSGDINEPVNIPSGGSITYTISVSVPSSQTGDLVNTATVTAPSGVTDPTPGNNSATDTDVEFGMADLSLVKTVDNPFPIVGEIVTFTIQIDNSGPSDATNVAVEDLVPNGYFNITNISNSGMELMSTIAWSGLVIPVGSLSLTFDATVDTPGVGINYINIARVSGADQFDPDSDPSNAADSNPGSGIGSVDPDGSQDPLDEDDGDDAEVTPQLFDLALTKTLDILSIPGPYLPGDTIQFIFTIYNQGDIPADSVAIIDYLPFGLTYADGGVGSMMTSGGTPVQVTYSGGIFGIDTLPAGDELSITARFRITPGLMMPFLTNAAEIAFASNPLGANDLDSWANSIPDDDAGGMPGSPADGYIYGDGTGVPGDGVAATDEDDHDSENVPVLQFFDLSIAKTVTSNPPYFPGGQVTYSISVSNEGTLDATDVIIVDYLPAGLILNDPNWKDNLDGTASLINPIPLIQPGTSASVTISFDIDYSTTGRITNAAEIESASNALGFMDMDSQPDNGSNGEDDFGTVSIDIVCPALVCQDRIIVSLNSSCEYPLSSRDIIRNVFIPNELLNWTITDKDGNRYNTNILDSRFLGQCVTVRVEFEVCNQQSCWVEVCVEDKYPPQIMCENDTVSCFNLEESADEIQLADNCQMYPVQTKILEKRWVDYGCDNPLFIGYLARKLRAEDVWGNYNECRDTLFVRRELLDSLVCGPDTLIACNLQHQLSNGTWVDVLWQTGKQGYTYLDKDGFVHPWPTDNQGLFPAPYLVSAQSNQDTAFLLPDRTDSGPVFNPTGKCQIVFEYEDHVISTCGKAFKIRRTWKIYDWCDGRDTTCTQWFKVEDNTPPYLMEEMVTTSGDLTSEQESITRDLLTANKDLLAYTDAHDCKAVIQLPDIRQFVERRTGMNNTYECDDQLELLYEVAYDDHSHPGKTIISQGNYDVEGGHIYLPEGWHYILWTIRDRCWNEYQIWQRVSVIDRTPPSPVCDEITQVTLDPDSCWARVYAKDLDDGSHDNCCDRLHYAVASMDSITYWRDYWHEYFAGCLDAYNYHHYSDYIDEAIEEWINIFVFDDYIDVTECGDEQLVLRVYEACDLPLYDPHTFFGGEHEWYWWNLSLNFTRWYFWRLNDYIHYGDPRAGFLCTIPAELDPAQSVSTPLNPIEWDIPNIASICDSDKSTVHGTYQDGVCFSYLYRTPADYQDFLTRVDAKYHSEAQITLALSEKKRWHFPHLYNDCMIQVLKDDKQPPVVIAPDDITVYCDGVPYHWNVERSYDAGRKVYSVSGYGAHFAHDVCSEDILSTYCSSPYISLGSDSQSGDIGPVSYCVEYPWSSEHGYYGGTVCPESNHYPENTGCDEYSEWYGQNDWSPIYCQIWLLLDQYDSPDGSKPEIDQYFSSTDADWQIYDNCSVASQRTQFSGSLNECGVGTLSKKIEVTDRCGNTAYDVQTVYVKPRSDFEVVFPADLIAECMDTEFLMPEISGRPVISDDDCELIGITYQDERFETGEGCYKILRTWKIIDWCVYQPEIQHRNPDIVVDDRLVASADRCCIHRNLKDDGDGFITYLQVIKVIDQIAPEVTCNDLSEICLYDDQCASTRVNVDLLGHVTDNCATQDEIRFRYSVLLNETELVHAQSGHVLDLELPVGLYGIWLIAEDRCNNADSCYSTFTIRDCKKPTPYCHTGITTVVMPSTGNIEVWAKDLDAGSYDNCSDQGNLRFSFTSDGLTPSLSFSCSDITNGKSQEFELEIWVIDESGNEDYCTTTLMIQDNSGNICPDRSPFSAGGVGIATPGLRVNKPQLYQNVPNPFSETTNIDFNLPETMEITLKLFDITGKEVYSHQGVYSRGMHRHTIAAGLLPDTKGVIFYQLQTPKGILNMRMIRVE